jgi:hypothetical protein
MTIDEMNQFIVDARELAATARSAKSRKAYEAAAIFAQERIDELSRQSEPVCRFGQGDYRRYWP